MHTPSSPTPLGVALNHPFEPPPLAPMPLGKKELQQVNGGWTRFDGVNPPPVAETKLIIIVIIDVANFSTSTLQKFVSFQPPTHTHASNLPPRFKNSFHCDAEFAAAVDALAQSWGEAARPLILSGDARLTRQQVARLAQLPAQEQKRQFQAFQEAG